MKRIAASLSAALLAALLVGCGSGSKTETPVDGNQKPLGGEKDGSKSPPVPPPPGGKKS